MKQLELGIIGLGKMGGNIALQAVEKGIKVVGMDATNKPELIGKGVKVVSNYDDLSKNLKSPRAIFLSLPAGKTIDTVITDLIPYINKGDVILDGGNSFFLDSINREKRLSEKGIFFLDCGTSGGIDGARNGACFMVGGVDQGVEIVKPILKKLAVKDGYIHTGQPGSGHFVKLVHNGIEFGMLQAIGEGFALLKNSKFDLNFADIFKNWSNGSVIRGWLIELMEKGLRTHDVDTKVEDYIEDTGEVNWLVQYAINEEIPIPVISHSIMELFKSRLQISDAYKAIALMRKGFGEHPLGPDDYIEEERSTSRIEKL